MYIGGIKFTVVIGIGIAKRIVQENKYKILSKHTYIFQL